MYDIIGDIHGHADELESLLQKLGYEKKNGIYQHLDRRVIFLGDFIDRGPKIRKTLQIVRPMIDSGAALAVMGNHEFNFLCYNCEIGPNNFLRKHNKDNNNQVRHTLKQFEGKLEDLNDYLNWFYTLPLYLELEEFRVVHACWKPSVIGRLKQILLNDRLSPDLLVDAGSKGTELYELIEVTLKGPEVDIRPDSFTDKDGKVRNDARIKWWLNPSRLRQCDYYFRSNKDIPLSVKMQQGWYYAEDEKPVFIGHYWKEGDLNLESPNVCCVDYSAAKPQSETPNPRLVSYQWSGGELNMKNFVCERRH